MKTIFVILSFFLMLGTSLAQNPFPHTDNITYLGNWDDDDLPQHDSGAYSDLWGFTPNESEIIVLSSYAYIHFIDVSNPMDMLEIARFETDNWNKWKDFKSYKNYVYGITESDNGLYIFDVCQAPDTVLLVAQNQEDFSNAHNIFIDEHQGRLYVAGRAHLEVFDLSRNPEQPAFLGNAAIFPDYIHDLYVEDNIAYCAAAGDGLYIYDYTDPQAPVYIASIESLGYCHSTWLSRDRQYAVVAYESFGVPMVMVDLENMMNDDLVIVSNFGHQLIETAPSPNIVHNPFIQGDLVYVSYYHDGVHIFDISDPTNPQWLGNIDTYPNNEDYENTNGCWGVYPFFPSGNVFASDKENGLIAFHVNGITPSHEVPSNEVLSDLDINIVNSLANTSVLLENNASTLEAPIFYEIITNQGQQLGRQMLDHCQSEIDISFLPAGLYYICFSQNEVMQTKKIIKI